jgi:hypothetical protein
VTLPPGESPFAVIIINNNNKNNIKGRTQYGDI